MPLQIKQSLNSANFRLMSLHVMHSCGHLRYRYVAPGLSRIQPFPSRTSSKRAIAPDVQALLQDELSIQPSQLEGFIDAGYYLDGVRANDIVQVVDTLLSLSSRERVKHLVLSHPSLLEGVELPGRNVFIIHCSPYCIASSMHPCVCCILPRF